jgi:hypothetical protein
VLHGFTSSHFVVVVVVVVAVTAVPAIAAIAAAAPLVVVVPVLSVHLELSRLLACLPAAYLYTRGRHISSCYVSVHVHSQIGDYDGAVNDLLRGGEIDLAYAVSVIASSGNREYALVRMAARCEGFGLIREAAFLLLDVRDGIKEVR